MPAEDKPIPTLVVSNTGDLEKKNKKSLFKWGTRKSKGTKNKEKKENNNKEGRMLSQTPDILPFIRIEADHIVLKNGVMDIFQISSYDLDTLNEDDLNRYVYMRVRFIRSYGYDYKEVALNFPINTTEQQNYWKSKRENTQNPVYLRHIDRKLEQLKFLEEERTNREFFLFIYADNKEQLEERRRIAFSQFKKSFPLIRISNKKKEDVLFMINNQNSKL
ncbi:hypothetical protein ABNF65_06505 [Paenibacillus larvae]